jgi:pyridoxamine 5'-phosphate oxidase
MFKTIAHLRRDYGLGSMSRNDLEPDPLAQFDKWFAQAEDTRFSPSRLRRIGIGFYKWVQLAFGAAPVDVNAMALATADKDGRPSVRMVLLKGIDERGFVFYTNYESRKGQELSENPHGALVFYWSDLERQVCITGQISKLPREESQAYFRTRPKPARLAAWASKQSTAISSRRELEERWQQAAAKYPGDHVPLPPFWGGYVLAPTRIEFWQGRLNRLHDRFCYTKQSDGRWSLERLAP